MKRRRVRGICDIATVIASVIIVSTLNLNQHSPPNMFEEIDILHVMMFIVGSFITILVLFDICDPTGMSYHNYLMGKKDDNDPSKWQKNKTTKKEK